MVGDVGVVDDFDVIEIDDFVGFGVFDIVVVFDGEVD